MQDLLLEETILTKVRVSVCTTRLTRHNGFKIQAYIGSLTISTYPHGRKIKIKKSVPAGNVLQQVSPVWLQVNLHMQVVISFDIFTF